MLSRRVLMLAGALRRASSSSSSEATIVDTENVQKAVFGAISEEVETSKRQRLFAVVYLNGRQWKVSDGDLISLEGSVPLSVGDSIRLEKVLMVGGANFSLFGRPLLEKSAAHVEALVVEKKTVSPELKYVHLNHQQTKLVNWQSDAATVLRIQKVTVGAVQQ